MVSNRLMQEVNELGEDALIGKLTENWTTGSGVVVGVGDDCAVVESADPHTYTLLKTDAVIEGVHFLADENYQRVGWKALARVVSDFAAMGGWGDFYLVTLALPADFAVDKVSALYRGLEICAQKFGGQLVGGETSSVPARSAAVISIAGTGRVKRDQLVKRTGASAGDVIYVTGQLGGSIRGKHLDFEPRVEAASWLAENFLPSSMMDLSDGLAKDLPRLADYSSCGYQLDFENIPLSEGCELSQALNDGEDYELLLTQPAEVADELELAWDLAFPDLQLSRIGICTSEPSDQLAGGWGHFSNK